MTIGNITNKFHRTKYNDAKYGFYPTPSEIVEKEMQLISFIGVSKDTPIPMCDFSGGIGEQLYTMHNYLSEKEGLTPVSYFNELHSERYQQARINYSGVDNFHMCSSDLFRLKCRHKSGKRYDSSVMSIIRNNSPYGETVQYGQKVRLEEIFFVENDRYLVPNGIHIIEFPTTTLINNINLLRRITYRYKDINIFRLPRHIMKKKHNAQVQQIVLFGVKKKKNSNDKELAQQLHEQLKLGKIKDITEINEPIYFLSDEIVKKAKEVTVYRDGTVNDITLTNGLNNELDSLLKKDKDTDLLNKNIQADKESIGIIEKKIGHRALDLASGKFNDVQGNVLIYGYSGKRIDTKVEMDEDTEITTETEVIVSGIEITNKNGTILRKES
ncbi:hypothetical protein [Senegalia massiliensis]|uniref:Uncharacterized protein n=1 Tax=Senegalia massiliensis TaxID=1720316 RepID=A0A845QZD7_9CLOT|nr:hypothetical protein [Senegalia massiliensis]NBI07530.1 hypothetical protein [Senegalia massiliensis]